MRAAGACTRLLLPESESIYVVVPVRISNDCNGSAFVLFFGRYGSRSKKNAANLLQRATHMHRRNQPRMSIVEALERAEWETNVDALFPLHRCLLDESEDAKGMEKVIATFVASLGLHLRISNAEVEVGQASQVPNDLLGFPAFVHIAVSWPWKQPQAQAACVALLLQKLHPGFANRLYRPRPLPQGDESLKVNVLQHAVERGCAPVVVDKVFKAQPQQSCALAPAAVACLCLEHASSIGGFASMTQQMLARRLSWRILSEGWTNDSASIHTGNGTAWFVPPCVKARELKMALTKFAEEQLRHEWQRQSRQRAGDGGTDDEGLDHQDGLGVDGDKAGSDDAWMVVPERQEVVHRGGAAEQQVRAGIDKWHKVRSRQPSRQHPNLAKIAPLAAALETKKSAATGNGLPNSGGGLLEAVIPASAPSPWKESFELAFVRPCVEVIKSFLQEELQIGSRKLRGLRELCEVRKKCRLSSDCLFAVPNGRLHLTSPIISPMATTTCVLTPVPGSHGRLSRHLQGDRNQVRRARPRSRSVQSPCCRGLQGGRGPSRHTFGRQASADA